MSKIHSFGSYVWLGSRYFICEFLLKKNVTWGLVFDFWVSGKPNQLMRISSVFQGIGGQPDHGVMFSRELYCIKSGIKQFQHL